MSESPTRPATVPDRVHTPIPITLSHRAEYTALRAASGALRGIGVRGASGFGARVGGLGFAPFRIRRGVAEEQIAKAFPNLGAAEVSGIARDSYENLGRTAMETMLLSSRSREDVIDMFGEVDGWHFVEEYLSRGNGLIFASGHVGNWELGGAYLAARGLPISAVARHMANPLVDRYLTRTRERLGLNVIHDEQAVRKVPRVIREGGAVAFLVDQAAAGLASTWVPFFGRLAKTPRGPAVFALRLNAPILFAGVSRLPDGRFKFSFEPVEVSRTGVLDADVDGIVAAYTSKLERFVRTVPGQYMWQHRRWKHSPPAEGEGQ
jgi:Kdo2-lipid IVA lauroyltransferase/acyltransferase